jgi:hypothetical protein
MKVPHRLVPNDDDYARTDRIELIMLDASGARPIVEIQYTLRRGVRGKITDFIRAATERASTEVPRIYLEIEDKIGCKLRAMADRLAHAIRDIVNDLGRLTKSPEQGNAVGLAVVFAENKSTKIFPMSLMGNLGTRAVSMLKALLPARKPASEQTQAAEPEPKTCVPADAPVEQSEQTQAAEPEPKTCVPADAPVEQSEKVDRAPRPTFGKKDPFVQLLARSMRRICTGFVPRAEPLVASACHRFPMRMPFRR